MLLTKDAIFAAEDIDYKVVHVPQWKGDVKIKVMSIAEQIEFETLNKNKKNESDLVFHMLAMCCIDEDGNKVFSKEDLPAIQKKSSAAVLHLFKECLDLNSLNPDDLEKAAKNS